MENSNLPELYQEATLALFSSLDIQTAIQALHQVLKRVLPLESLVLHLVDKEERQFRIIADATKLLSEPFKLTEIPEHLNHESQWEHVTTNRPYVYSGVPKDSLLELLLRKYGYTSDTIYWTPLILDHQHFGGFSALVESGHVMIDEGYELLNSLSRPLTIALANALRYEEINSLRKQLKDDNARLRNELSDIKGVNLIHETAGLSGVVKSVERVARLETPVLILGETGVGKELVANSIHTLSPRRDEPFITVNCGALPGNIADSYLFGH